MLPSLYLQKDSLLPEEAGEVLLALVLWVLTACPENTQRHTSFRGVSNTCDQQGALIAVRTRAGSRGSEQVPPDPSDLTTDCQTESTTVRLTDASTPGDSIQGFP